MGSAVHVVGIEGVVFSLEGGKEKGDGYKSDFPTPGKRRLCRARTRASTKPTGGKEHPGPASGTEPGAENSSPRWSAHQLSPKKRPAGDHRTIFREETM